MSIADHIAAGITTARTAAEQTLNDEVTVTRAGTESFNSGTGLVTASDTAVWSGACTHLDPSGTRTGELGGQQVADDEHVILVPVDGTDGIRAGDHATIDGAGYTIRRVGNQTHMVLRHLVAVTADRTPEMP